MSSIKVTSPYLFLPFVTSLILLLCIKNSAASSETLHCVSDIQPLTNFTCSAFDKSDHISIQVTSTSTSPSSLDYVDAVVFHYESAPMRSFNKSGRATIVTAMTGSCGSPSDCLALAIKLIDEIAPLNVDVVLFPEDFALGDPEPIGGPMTKSLAESAMKHRIHVIFGMHELDVDGGHVYNTVVIIDRQGSVRGTYRKLFPCCPPPQNASTDMNENLWPGNTGVGIADLDFGRIGVAVCFDANFPEVWQQLYAKRADVVFWPSAYGGGMPLHAYAALYKYYIVPNGWGDIIDITGQTIKNLKRFNSTTTSTPVPMTLATIDVDRTFFHKDYNDNLHKLIDDNKEFITMIDLDETNAYLLSRTDEGYRQGVSVRDLIPKYGLETLREYQIRTRRTINEARQLGKILK